ncbi:MAG: cation diffusion facilitator family transporter [Roseburia sp.]
MITLLARWFIPKDSDQTAARSAYGMICGVVGIFLNVLLSVGKFVAGSLSGSISITADAFNNLSDAGSSLVTLVGFKIAGSKPDSEHPYGHGRVEYLAGLVVSAAILIMAVELIRDSVDRILHPEDTAISGLSILILLVSILVKLYMTCYNHSVAKKIDSAAMAATAMDSLSDSIATFVVLLAAVVQHVKGWHVDGYCGVVVGLFIFYTGISAARETLDPLMGQPPDKTFVRKVKELVMQEPMVLGVHDLRVHDYGPGQVLISLHAEVPAEGNLMEIHNVIDRAEKRLDQELHCEAVIHMDPVVTNDANMTRMRHTVEQILHDIGEKLHMHDFRVLSEEEQTMLFFDVVVPYRYSLSDEEIIQRLELRIKDALGEKISLVVKIDKGDGED